MIFDASWIQHTLPFLDLQPTFVKMATKPRVSAHRQGWIVDGRHRSAAHEARGGTSTRKWRTEWENNLEMDFCSWENSTEVYKILQLSMEVSKGKLTWKCGNHTLEILDTTHTLCWSNMAGKSEFHWRFLGTSSASRAQKILEMFPPSHFLSPKSGIFLGPKHR